MLEKRKSGGCETVCKIDGVEKVGTPEIVESDDSGSGSGGLSTGAKAGIAVGVVIAVLLFGAVGFFLWRKRKTAKAREGYELGTKDVGSLGGETR
jgi:LPXTG-motif cell wall-anchored protein